MLDRLAFETWDGLAKFLTQRDRVSLTYVSSSVRSSILPILYRNIFLNEKPCIYSDSDPLLGNFWSALNVRGLKIEDADQKLSALIQTLRESALLSSYVENVQCTWHLNNALLQELLGVLVSQASHLRHFRNYLTTELVDDLKKIAPQLQSVDIPPPGVLPQQEVSSSYLPNMKDLVQFYSFDNITSLNIYMDPGQFFSNYAASAPKLRLRELGLSLRNDNYDPASFQAARYTYSEIFDVRYLEMVTILSWYEAERVDVYEKYHLRELLEFKNLKELTLLSLYANESFLRECIRSFTQLRRLKLDFMLGHRIEQETLALLARSPAHLSLQYLDLKCAPLDPYLVTVLRGNASRFEIAETCICPTCRDVAQDIIRKKFFPTHSSLHIRSLEDIPKRDIITRIVSVSPIVPYALFVDTRPGLSFIESPAEDVARILNKALGKNMLVAEDIVKVYHAHLHSLKRTFTYFLQRFPNLKFLTVNDVPTSVEEGPGGQKYNQPIYHNQGYQNNQVYEVVDYDNLFG
ncbi:LAME_0G07932g1_1 [Lachancea meyersii CBS 8951]|uniref:LAME_0G07932g1_1 n=1 Tax=Lachancea meyersii CBS 8951 TaxID=1266667 RepID=A0A1G4K875_9SACH|nr:LAME_0G07932g1_1 [Lachancea meyersii CBS 8951]